MPRLVENFIQWIKGRCKLLRPYSYRQPRCHCYSFLFKSVSCAVWIETNSCAELKRIEGSLGIFVLLLVPLRISFGSNISILLAANHRKSFTISQYNSQLDMPLLISTSASIIALRFSFSTINKKGIVSARKVLWGSYPNHRELQAWIFEWRNQRTKQSQSQQSHIKSGTQQTKASFSVANQVDFFAELNGHIPKTIEI